MFSYAYGELVSKNYKSNLSQNNPSSFYPRDNQSFSNIMLGKVVIYNHVLHSHMHKLWHFLLYTLHKFQIPNNVGIDLVVNIMKLSFGLIVRYLFEES